MLGADCRPLLGTMTALVSRVCVGVASEYRSLSFRQGLGGSPGLRQVWGELGTGVPQTSLRYWPGTTTQTAQLENILGFGQRPSDPLCLHVVYEHLAVRRCSDACDFQDLVVIASGHPVDHHQGDTCVNSEGLLLVRVGNHRGYTVLLAQCVANFFHAGVHPT